jgi:hypothetical protein
VKSPNVEELARRDWGVLADVKRAHVRARFRDGGADATLRAAAALWTYMRSIRPDWPSARARADDLAHHVELKRLIDRASDALTRR